MELEKYESRHLNILKKYLPECIVMLKNDTDFTTEKAGKIALFGNGVRNTLKGGTGSGEVNSRYYVTIEEAFVKAGFQITSKEWLNSYEQMKKSAKKEFVKQIKKEAKAAHMQPIMYGMGMAMPEPEYEISLNAEGDSAIYVVSRICGEGNDRKAVSGDFMLSETEQRDILELNKKFQNFLLVLNVGGPIDLSPVISVPNIVLLSQLGVDTGTVLAQLVLGEVYPSGKLTTTWSKWEDYCSLGDFGNKYENEYKEGLYVGYRYFDTIGKKAMFPFGFGLGFTKFEIQVEEIKMEKTVLTVRTSVKNVGGKPGKEVVQIYASLPEGELSQPYQILAGFKKSEELFPGVKESINIKIDIRDLSSFHEKSSSYILEQGSIVFKLGDSSIDTSDICIVNIEETVKIKQVKNSLSPTKIEEIALERSHVVVDQTLPIYKVKNSDFMLEVVDYQQNIEINPLVKKLTDEELIYLCVGEFDPNGGMASVIGSASKSLCGAAGESSSKAHYRGIPSMIMADGPAGLRLSRDYYEQDNTFYAVGNPMIESMYDLMGPVAVLMMKRAFRKKHGVEVKHHYATAIPIGTAIAQSWNIDFAEICGDIVGDEMERFGVHLWLAPALNIHRNILCGRNFEYYSEDPLISGKMAAAITRGVQKHNHCGTVIKHYAANNQEVNRYDNNSIVSERTMRDLYLKGFEICIKESQPKALMTSYNLLNGIHTSERKDLNEDVLRSEFGFEGMVMTDWVVSSTEDKNSKHKTPDAYKVALSGNDLFMPGSKCEIDNLTNAINEGLITREQLEKNVTRIVELALDLV